MYWICVILMLCSSVALGEVAFEVFPLPGENYSIKNDGIYFRSGDYGLILKGADALTRSSYYAERGHNGADPLDRLIQPETTIFLLTLINRSPMSLEFAPGKVTLNASSGSHNPLEGAAFLQLLRQLSAGVQNLLKQSVFYQTESVGAGQVISKFLIFTKTPQQDKDLHLSIGNQFFPPDSPGGIYRFSKAKVIRN